MNQPGSLWSADPAPLLDEWVDLLQGVRNLMRQPTDGKLSSSPARMGPLSKRNQSRSPAPDQKSSLALINDTIKTDSETDFDVGFATVPLSYDGNRAVYWVHPEQIMELQVLLLQYMSPFPTSGRRRSGGQTPKNASPVEPRAESSLSDRPGDAHVVVIDELDNFAQTQSSVTVSDAEDSADTIPTRAAGTVCWSGNGEGVIVLDPTAGPGNMKSAKIKPKYLGALLDTSKPFHRRRSSAASSIGVTDTDVAKTQEQNTNQAREWLSQHKDMEPLVVINSKRTRFVGTHNDRYRVTWASLNTDITMSRAPSFDRMTGEWVDSVNDSKTAFPYAVLEVRDEGRKSGELIDILDRSHLVSHFESFTCLTATNIACA